MKSLTRLAVLIFAALLLTGLAFLQSGCSTLYTPEQVATSPVSRLTVLPDGSYLVTTADGAGVLVPASAVAAPVAAAATPATAADVAAAKAAPKANALSTVAQDATGRVIFAEPQGYALSPVASGATEAASAIPGYGALLSIGTAFLLGVGKFFMQTRELTATKGALAMSAEFRDALRDVIDQTPQGAQLERWMVDTEAAILKKYGPAAAAAFHLACEKATTPDKPAGGIKLAAPANA